MVTDGGGGVRDDMVAMVTVMVVMLIMVTAVMGIVEVTG